MRRIVGTLLLQVFPWHLILSGCTLTVLSLDFWTRFDSLIWFTNFARLLYSYELCEIDDLTIFFVYNTEEIHMTYDMMCMSEGWICPFSNNIDHTFDMPAF